MGNNQRHIVPNSEKGGWDEKKSGASRASKHFDTKDEAISHAREVAKKNKEELIIHNKDGKIAQRNSYGNDPYPPKG